MEQNELRLLGVAGFAIGDVKAINLDTVIAGAKVTRAAI
jgi:hypothetical protein